MRGRRPRRSGDGLPFLPGAAFGAAWWFAALANRDAGVLAVGVAEGAAVARVEGVAAAPACAVVVVPGAVVLPGAVLGLGRVEEVPVGAASACGAAAVGAGHIGKGTRLRGGSWGAARRGKTVWQPGDGPARARTCGLDDRKGALLCVFI